MNSMSILNQLQKIYRDNGNIIDYLKLKKHTDTNCLEDIMISYDLQAGSYVAEYHKKKEWKDIFIERLAKYIENNNIRGTVLEAGVGEATTLVPLMFRLKGYFDKIYGFDISWSRIKVAQAFADKNNCQNSNLFVGDMFNIPVVSNSIDLVYTCHAIEPNGGRESELLKELYRVTKKYLILIEPAYELADEAAKKRMEQYGYITNLYGSAQALGYNVVEYSLYGISANKLNPTGFLVIEKEQKTQDYENQAGLCCPVTMTPLKKVNGAYFSQDSLLAYPIVNGVPCLTKQNAIVASKFI